MYRLGEHVRLNTKKEETGGSEVVEITFAGNIEQPPVTQDSQDSAAVENVSESIVIWTGIVGLITMREPKNIVGNDAEETWDQGGYISLRKSFDNKGIRFGHRRGQKSEGDNEESHSECVKEQRNVTKDWAALTPNMPGQNPSLPQWT